jgi:hypothetical protein
LLDNVRHFLLLLLPFVGFFLQIVNLFHDVVEAMSVR